LDGARLLADLPMVVPLWQKHGSATMIPYTNNFRDHKPYVYLGLAIAAFLTWELLGWAAQELKTLQIAGLPALTVPFSVMTTLYLGYLTLFDHFLWHLWPIRWLLRIPNLTGEWLGERFRGDETEPSGRFTVTIKQTWSHISIETRNADPKSKAPPTSTSMSTSASFVTSDMSGVEFLFTYT
jgi:hypothetical protein